MATHHNIFASFIECSQTSERSTCSPISEGQTCWRKVLEQISWFSKRGVQGWVYNGAEKYVVGHTEWGRLLRVIMFLNGVGGVIISNGKKVTSSTNGMGGTLNGWIACMVFYVFKWSHKQFQNWVKSYLSNMCNNKLMQNLNNNWGFECNVRMPPL